MKGGVNIYNTESVILRDVTVEKTLSLPTITGGTVSIRLLVLNAPADIQGTIVLE